MFPKLTFPAWTFLEGTFLCFTQSARAYSVHQPRFFAAGWSHQASEAFNLFVRQTAGAAGGTKT
jgi:hypothetical protein